MQYDFIQRSPLASSGVIVRKGAYAAARALEGGQEPSGACGYARTRRLPFHDVSDEEILGDFEDAAAVDGLDWRDSLWEVGRIHGLIDVGGKPTSQWAARVIAKARTAHRRWRRDYLENKMASAMVNCWEGDQAPLLELYRKLGKAKAKALQTRIEAQWNAVRATLARAPESEAPTGKNCAE